MVQTCPKCSTHVEVDLAAPLPSGVASWACPQCRAPLPPAGPVSQAAGARACPTPELDTWLRAELAAIRAEAIACARRTEHPSQPGGTASGAARERPALVCCADFALARALEGAVRGLGHAVEILADARAASVRLAEANAAVVVLDLGLGGDPKVGLGLLDQVGRLPPHRRRQTFVACVSESMRTLDFAAAFACGADLTLSAGEPAGFGEAFAAGLAARDDLYRVYNETVASLHG